MNRLIGKVAVVTGASSGIGAATAAALVNKGLKVVGLARRKERVEDLSEKLSGKSGKLYGLQADVRNEQDVIDAIKWTQSNLGPIHVLVNNAGVVKWDTLIDGSYNNWKSSIDTNILGLCTATREAVRSMRANNIDGHIVHMNSITGHKVSRLKSVNVYPATKYAVTALTEVLRQELNAIDSKIKITSISPGLVKTEIAEASGAGLSYSENVFKLPYLLPEDVADAVIYVLATPPHVQIHELIIKPIGERE